MNITKINISVDKQIRSKNHMTQMLEYQNVVLKAELYQKLSIAWPLGDPETRAQIYQGEKDCM